MAHRTVYATQGGGTAQADADGTLRFITPPATGTRLSVGDSVPDEWGLQVTGTGNSTVAAAFQEAEARASDAEARARRSVDAWMNGGEIGETLGDILEETLEDPPPSAYDDVTHGGNYEHG